LIEKKDRVWFTDDLEGAMYELALLSGYDESELNSKRYPIYSKVMNEIAYRCLKSLKSKNLNRKNQERNQLARQAENLLGEGLDFDEIAQELLKKYVPKDHLKTNLNVWNKETIEQLIDKYSEQYDYEIALELRSEKGQSYD